MDWKLLATTFVGVFLAEMGDKTQLATLSLAASGSSRWIVFIGAASALVLTSAIAVVFGEAAARYVPEIWLKRGAGALLVVVGVLLLLSKPAGPASG